MNKKLNLKKIYLLLTINIINSVCDMNNIRELKKTYIAEQNHKNNKLVETSSSINYINNFEFITNEFSLNTITDESFHIDEEIPDFEFSFNLSISKSSSSIFNNYIFNERENNSSELTHTIRPKKIFYEKKNESYYNQLYNIENISSSSSSTILNERMNTNYYIKNELIETKKSGLNVSLLEDTNNNLKLGGKKTIKKSGLHISLLEDTNNNLKLGGTPIKKNDKTIKKSGLNVSLLEDTNNNLKLGGKKTIKKSGLHISLLKENNFNSINNTKKTISDVIIFGEYSPKKIS